MFLVLQRLGPTFISLFLLLCLAPLGFVYFAVLDPLQRLESRGQKQLLEQNQRAVDAAMIAEVESLALALQIRIESARSARNSPEEYSRALNAPSLAFPKLEFTLLAPNANSIGEFSAILPGPGEATAPRTGLFLRGEILYLIAARYVAPDLGWLVLKQPLAAESIKAHLSPGVEVFPVVQLVAGGNEWRYLYISPELAARLPRSMSDFSHGYLAIHQGPTTLTWMPPQSSRLYSPHRVGFIYSIRQPRSLTSGLLEMIGGVAAGTIILFALALAWHAKSLQKQEEQLTQFMQEIREGNANNALTAELLGIFSSLGKQANELLFQVAAERAEIQEYRFETERKVYDLERRAYAADLSLEIARAMHSIPEPSTALAAAAEVIGKKFTADMVAVLERSGTAGAMNPLVVKRKVPGTEFYSAGREFSSANSDLSVEAFTEVRESIVDTGLSGIARTLALVNSQGQPLNALLFSARGADSVPLVFLILTKAEGYFFTESETTMLKELGVDITHFLELAHKYDSSTLDLTTKLLNLRFFQQTLTTEILRARRSSNRFALIALEIDDFNRITKSLTAAIADDIVRDVAALVRTICRSTDYLCRKEGVRFLILLPDTPPEGAAVVAEKLRSAVEGNVSQTKQGPVRVTLSVGAAFYPEQGNLPKELLDAAEKSLQEVLSSGGNRALINLRPTATKTKAATT